MNRMVSGWPTALVGSLWQIISKKYFKEQVGEADTILFILFILSKNTLSG